MTGPLVDGATADPPYGGRDGTRSLPARGPAARRAVLADAGCAAIAVSWCPSPTGSGGVEAAGRGSAPRAADAHGSSDIPRRASSTSSGTRARAGVQPAVAGRWLRGCGALFTRHDLLIVHPLPTNATVRARAPRTPLLADPRYADPGRTAPRGGSGPGGATPWTTPGAPEGPGPPSRRTPLTPTPAGERGSARREAASLAAGRGPMRCVAKARNGRTCGSRGRGGGCGHAPGWPEAPRGGAPGPLRFPRGSALSPPEGRCPWPVSGRGGSGGPGRRTASA